jgi:hypothetical protein
MSNDALSALQTLNARFIHNFVTNDVASHDAILHPGFECLTQSGLRMNRQDYLKSWATGFDPDVIVYWDYRNEKISIFGNVAFVYSVNKSIRMRDGAEVTGMSYYVDTYLLENGAWKCVLAHMTTMQPQNYPADDTIVKKYIRGKMVPNHIDGRGSSL